MPTMPLPYGQAVQVLREDLVLAHPILELDGAEDLEPLRERAVRAAVHELHELLRDRRGAAAAASGHEILTEGAHGRDVIDPPVLAKSLVLHGDHGVDHVRVDLLERDPASIDTLDARTVGGSGLVGEEGPLVPQEVPLTIDDRQRVRRDREARVVDQPLVNARERHAGP
jgi:hypothetical protein